MSDRRLLLALLVAMAPTAMRAQSLDSLRAELARAEARAGAATARQRQLRDARQFGADASITAGGRRLRYRAAELSSRDSAAIARGLALGVTRLRERFGDAGASLADTASLGVSPERRGVMGSYLIFTIASPYFTQVQLSRPVDEEQVARFVAHQAGDRLIGLEPVLAKFAGYSALLPDDGQDEEIARRLATSWSAAGRRCASGGLGACAAVAEPIGPGAPLDRYFDESDYRTVVASAKLPLSTDSIFFASRRRCLAGADSACARIVPALEPADPFGLYIRGSILAHAISIGGRDAVARLLASHETSPLAVMATAAGVSEDSLLTSWHTKIFESVRRSPFDLVAPFLTALAWGALLLVVAMRRRYL